MFLSHMSHAYLISEINGESCIWRLAQNATAKNFKLSTAWKETFTCIINGCISSHMVDLYEIHPTVKLRSPPNKPCMLKTYQQ